MRIKNKVKISIFAIFMVLLIGLIIAAPSFNPSGTTSHFNENRTSLFEYNFTANTTYTPGADILVYSIKNISSSLYPAQQNPSFYPWISINASTGVMTMNSTMDNQTGRYNISIEVVNQVPEGMISVFYFIINATNDAPNFTALQSEYNLSQEQLFTRYVNASDEEEHYPLYFNISFNLTGCTHASWSTRTNCTLFNFTSTTNTSALMNFTPSANDVGTYYANVSVMDYGENYTCISGYCAPGYSQNKTTYYFRLVTFNILSSLTINVSNCQNKIFQENTSGACFINITTKGDIDLINISSYASVRNYPASVSNRSWFYKTNLTNSSGNVQTAYINVTAQKTEIGNWTINFTISDLTSGENLTSQIYVYVNRTLNDVPELASISNKNTSINLLTRINLTVYDDDLLVLDKLQGYNETINFTTHVYNASNLTQQFNLSNFSVQVLNMPIVGTNITEAKIEFTPNLSDVGSYTINISIIDRANSATSKIFNLTILNNDAPLWNASLLTTFVIYENNNTYLNLSLNASDPNGDSLTFSYTNDGTFPSFNLTGNGVINFTSIDADVGQHIFQITVTDGYLTNATSFNFTIYNINDNPFLETPLTAVNASIGAESNINCSEDNYTTVTLWIQDDDFKIPSNQKSFYNETLTININITGPNSTLLRFVKDSAFPTTGNNRSKYDAIFILSKTDVGAYNVTLNITDLNNASSFIRFNLTVNSLQHNPILMNLTNKSSAVNRSFYYRINATDSEDGNSVTSGNRNFTFSYINLSGLNIFNATTFNKTTGEINISFNDSQSGSYNLNITVNDSSGREDSNSFWIYVYNIPTINSPASSYEFNLTENLSSNLSFKLNHSVQGNLSYLIYIEDINISNLLYNSTYLGNNSNLTFQFIPNFTDETYGIKNLTLIAYTDDSNLVNRTNINITYKWNLTINHANYPLEFLTNIGGAIQEISGNSPQTIVLSSYFSDLDASDKRHNQTINFSYSLIHSSGGIISVRIANWTNGNSPNITFSASSNGNANYSITGYEYNESNSSQIINTVLSNNFSIILTVETTIVTVPTSGGGSSPIPVAFKIITPGKISAYAYKKIEIPLKLSNQGSLNFNSVNFTSEAFKGGNIFKRVQTSFNQSFFSTLRSGETKNLILTVLFNDINAVGDYEILVNATSINPVYTDWNKIYINLQKINETDAENYILFTEEFIVDNPECVELQEIVKEARKYFDNGDYFNARLKAEEAINACKEYISQVSLPEMNFLGKYGINEYLVLTTLGSFLIGIAYYSFKRRRFKKNLNQSIKIYD